MGVSDVEDLTVIIIIIITLKFIKLALEEDEVVFLRRFDAVFLQKVHSKHVSKVLELFYHFLVW